MRFTLMSQRRGRAGLQGRLRSSPGAVIFSWPVAISGGRAVINYFRMLTRPQLHAYLAALGGWSLDALDFFVFLSSLSAISAEFHTTVKAVSEGVDEAESRAFLGGGVRHGTHRRGRVLGREARRRR